MTAIPASTEVAWTRAELLKAWKNNEVAGMAAVGLTVQFLLKSGDTRGVVVHRNGCIKRFRSDASAWAFINNLKEDSFKHSD